ncbi:MAG: nucleoside triphosphate pyrophosphohydrolase [bacterium]
MENCLFQELLAIMSRLRGEGGCPWDREQTIESLKPFLIEECHEVIEAIEEGDPHKIQEELGDLLFQIIFLAQIGKEQGTFDIARILTTISEKMIRRHPHVFSDDTASHPSEVLARWEEIKRMEDAERKKGRNAGNGPSSVLNGIPKGLPSMTYAHRVQAKASRVGFDWPLLDEVMVKLDEEIGEFRDAVAGTDPKKIEDELGDVLFTMVNISRFLRIDPEGALRSTVRRFIERFQAMERVVTERGKTMSELDIHALDLIWEEVKNKIS